MSQRCENVKASSPSPHQFVRSRRYCYQRAAESFPDVPQELEVKGWFRMHFLQ